MNNNITSKLMEIKNNNDIVLIFNLFKKHFTLIIEKPQNGPLVGGSYLFSTSSVFTCTYLLCITT